MSGHFSTHTFKIGYSWKCLIKIFLHLKFIVQTINLLIPETNLEGAGQGCSPSQLWSKGTFHFLKKISFLCKKKNFPHNSSVWNFVTRSWIKFWICPWLIHYFESRRWEAHVRVHLTRCECMDVLINPKLWTPSKVIVHFIAKIIIFISFIQFLKKCKRYPNKLLKN